MNSIALSRILSHWQAIQPDSIAISHEEQSISWRQLEAQSNQLARYYQSLGVKENDFVTIALPNSIEFFLACFATWKLGATPQPVSARLPDFELQQIIELANPALVVGAETDKAAASLPANAKIPDSFSSAELPKLIADSFKAMTSGGSTGRPKLIVSKSPATWDIDAPFLEIQPQGRMLIPGPLYHNGPFTWAMVALFRGNLVSVTTRFDAETTLALIEQHQIDIIYTVPTMMQRIWKLDDAIKEKYDLSSLKTLWHLAAPCPAWLKHAFIEWLGPDVIWELYGGTEGTGTTVIQGGDWLAHEGSVGQPGANCEMKVIDEDGAILSAGEIGEVFIRPLSGPGTTYKYIGAEAKVIEGGWESLGDMGYLDEDGYLYLADRQTDMILSGGANIYPAEIEAAIDAFDGVRSSAVIGLPHEDLGNTVHAMIDAPGGLDEAQLIEHLNNRLVRYKVPRSYEYLDEPLRDDAGKVRRKQLRMERIKT